jgi:hypothetical protein
MSDPNEGFSHDLGQFYGTAAQVIPALLLILSVETGFLRLAVRARVVDSERRIGLEVDGREWSVPRSRLTRAVLAALTAAGGGLLGGGVNAIKIYVLVFAPLLVVASAAAECLAFFKLAASSADQIAAGFAVPFIGIVIGVLVLCAAAGIFLAVREGPEARATTADGSEDR